MNDASSSTSTITVDPPRGDLDGLRRHWRFDLLSGGLVFLIALPLCLGISIACGYPPLAGIFTAIIGSIVATFISNSELTIKGPAAGLIVIAIGTIEDFGGNGLADGWTSVDTHAYQLALAVGVAAAALQIVFGLLRAGILGEFFPLSAVHGMLAAIGVIIVAKQAPVVLGVLGAKGEPLELLAHIPDFIANLNPEIAMIGLVSLAIMFSWPVVTRRIKALKFVPAPLVVVLFSIPMGMGFDLTHHHAYTLFDHSYEVGEEFLVAMPDHAFGMFEEITTPDFSALAMPKAWKWVMLFFVIGSVESLLSAKAVDIIDPYRRKTNLDRDVLAVGVGNLLSSLVGGLPMISEIVRSKANIDNGARTRFADMWHGIFLLLCVGLIPTVLHLIPLAALAAMLVYTGFRLAHPSEFNHVKQIGTEQLLIFVVTVVGVLATDLLVGIAIGIATEFVLHSMAGLNLGDLFRSDLETQVRSDGTLVVAVRKAAVFSNWIPIKRRIESEGLAAKRNVVLDVSRAKLVDHSVMEKLHEMRGDFTRAGLSFELSGLDLLQKSSSSHARAARRRGLRALRRLTVVTSTELATQLQEAFVARGATGFTTFSAKGAGRTALREQGEPQDVVRIEVVVPNEAADAITEYLRDEILPNHRVTVCLETVEVLDPGGFIQGGGE
ncbi:MAG: SulP family inorganic anion transporter [Myxococcales bacterium]|nr:SulP family inorganic anion transporter [Myxococcales bacterium]